MDFLGPHEYTQRYSKLQPLFSTPGWSTGLGRRRTEAVRTSYRTDIGRQDLHQERALNAVAASAVLRIVIVATRTGSRRRPRLESVFRSKDSHISVDQWPYRALNADFLYECWRSYPLPICTLRVASDEVIPHIVAPAICRSAQLQQEAQTRVRSDPVSFLVLSADHAKRIIRIFFFFAGAAVDTLSCL